MLKCKEKRNYQHLAPQARSVTPVPSQGSGPTWVLPGMLMEGKPELLVHTLLSSHPRLLHTCSTVETTRKSAWHYSVLKWEWNSLLPSSCHGSAKAHHASKPHVTDGTSGVTVPISGHPTDWKSYLLKITTHLISHKRRRAKFLQTVKTMDGRKRHSFLKKFVFIYLWLGQVFSAAHGLSLVVVGRSYS